jgi:hypothetical protein
VAAFVTKVGALPAKQYAVVKVIFGHLGLILPPPESIPGFKTPEGTTQWLNLRKKQVSNIAVYLLCLHQFCRYFCIVFV